MNYLQAKVLEDLIYGKVKEAIENVETEIPNALYQALDCGENDLEDAILELLENQAYIQPDEMGLNVDSIDVILEFAKDKELSLEFGFGSVLETFVIDQVGIILDYDLLEDM